MLPVNSLEKLRIGGIDQWVLFRGSSDANPILLFLHGGPGMPVFPFAHQIKGHSKLEDYFTVVYWEQRGTGKSYSPRIPVSSMKIGQFVDDAIELTHLLVRRFGKSRVSVLGHSWGTIIGTLAIQRAPDLFQAYVGMGQIVDMMQGEHLSYEWVRERARQSGNKKALRELSKIGPPPHDHKKIIIERKWVSRFGGNRRKNPHSFMTVLVEILRTKEYTWVDVVRIAANPLFSLKHLLSEMYTVNFFAQAPRLEIPVFFLEGRFDYTTPSEVTTRYYHELDAPRGKELICFDDSAHFPFLEEPAKFDH